MAYDRRDFLRIAGGAAIGAPLLHSLLFSQEARAAIGDTLTIAYNVILPAWDPNTGPSAVSPGIQSIYRTVFDPYFTQAPDLSLKPGLMDAFGWNEGKTAIHLRLREGATWQDGKPITPDDVVWNLKRMTDPNIGNPLQSIFASLKNIRADGRTITFEVDPWRANMLERLTFLACYLLPPHYFEAVGKEGFERKPLGSGPYMVDQYERGSFLRLKAYDGYWGGKPQFQSVVFKFVTDATSRIAEIERGSSDITLDIPFEEFDRLKKKPGLAGEASPTADIALIFFNNVGPFADENVRRAAVFAVDKKAIVQRLLRGYATPVDQLLAPQYGAYDPTITTPYNPDLAKSLLAKSGFSPQKPVELTIQTTRGYKPKDYETVEAIAEMWRKVGIKANIEIYEIAKHFELRTQHKLAPAAFYDWGNSTADPESSLGSSLLSTSPHSSWKGGELDDQLKALFVEHDTAKRMEGYKKLDHEVAEHAYILPLFQYYQPVVYKAELSFKPHLAGYVLPYTITRKGA